MVEAAIFVIFPFCMVYAALSDMVSMTIANRVSVILVLAFAVLAPFTGMEWSAYAWHFAAGGIVLAGAFGLFAIGAMGGGDAKLLAATAVWMGFDHQLMAYLLVSTILGGMLTLALVIYRNSPLSFFTGRIGLLRHFADQKAGIPYGVALGIGGLMSYPASPLMLWATSRLLTG
jgi:prepilin peptidase CpaA